MAYEMFCSFIVFPGMHFFQPLRFTSVRARPVMLTIPQEIQVTAASFSLNWHPKVVFQIQ
jgi:hypothetical protein